MATRETLQSIRAWARTSFPENFATFDRYIQTSDFTYLHSHVQVSNEVSSHKVTSILVGTSGAAKTPIYAWREKGAVDIGHEVGDGILQPRDDLSEPPINFAAPFCWVNPTENEVGIARFEALVRYLVLTRKPRAVLTHRIDFFKTHFKGACREVAEHLDRINDQTPPVVLPQASAETRVQTPQMPRTPQTLLETPTRPSRFPQAPSVMRSSPTVLLQRPATPASPSLANDLHLKNLDQTFMSFRASFFAQTGAAQAASRQETAELNDKIRDLEIELVSARNETKDLDTQSTGLNIRIQELEAKILDVEKEKTDLVTQSTAQSATVSSLEARLATADSNTADLEKTATELKDQICVLDSSLQDANKAIKEKEADIKDLNTTLHSLEAKLKSAEKESSRAQAQAQKHKSKISDLDARLKSATAARKDMEKAVADLEGRIADAEAEKRSAETKAELWEARYQVAKKEILDVAVKLE